MRRDDIRENGTVHNEKKPHINLVNQSVASSDHHQHVLTARIVDALTTCSDVITWNKDWQLVYNINAIPGTNVIDLDDYLVQAMKN